MKIISAVAAMILLAAFGATAQTTNDLSDAEIQGRNLAQKILEQRPTENSSATGILQIRDRNGNRSEIPVICRAMVTIFIADTNLVISNWLTFYQAALTKQTNYLRIIHVANLTNIYSYSTNANDAVPVLGDIPLSGHFFPNHQVSGSALMTPFAHSDFWIADLGLEFFHWPEQKILKKENRRSRGCIVLESTNPNPSRNGYSRVVSWIDEETLGIVHAEAYDFKNKLLKEFDPKSFKKVNGQWELQEMEIDNVQTGSRTRLEFTGFGGTNSTDAANPPEK